MNDKGLNWKSLPLATGKKWGRLTSGVQNTTAVLFEKIKYILWGIFYGNH